jgi:hypothetical protein
MSHQCRIAVKEFLDMRAVFRHRHVYCVQHSTAQHQGIHMHLDLTSLSSLRHSFPKDRSV